MINDLITKLQHLPDDRIGDNIYTAFEWTIDGNDRKLCRLYIGSKTCGPMLQYDADGYGKYTGYVNTNYKGGAWTNLYSRGNFGKKYAFGGNWSGHTKNLHTRLKISPIVDMPETVWMDKGKPAGTVMDLDCSGSWSIWYTSAKMAFASRLKRHEFAESTLPDITKNHLILNETERVIDAINDIIEAYEL